MYVVHAPGIAPALLQEILRMELKLLGPWELDLWPIPQGRGHRGVGRRVGRWRWSWRWRGGGRFWHRIHLISWNMIRNRTFLPRARWRRVQACYIHTYIHTIKWQIDHGILLSSVSFLLVVTHSSLSPKNGKKFLPNVRKYQICFINIL